MEFNANLDATTLGFPQSAIKVVVNRTFLQVESTRMPVADFVAHAGVFKRRAYSDAFLLGAAKEQETDAASTCCTESFSSESGSDKAQFDSEDEARNDLFEEPEIPMIHATSPSPEPSQTVMVSKYPYHYVWNGKRTYPEEHSAPPHEQTLEQEIAKAEFDLALAHAKLAANRANLNVQTQDNSGLPRSTAALPHGVGIHHVFPGYPYASGMSASISCAAELRTDECTRTTIILRSLPNGYSRDMVLELLDSEGFKGRYDFFYLPVDFKNHSGLGYAFLNMITPGDAQRAKIHLSGFTNWTRGSNKVLEVQYTQGIQGLAANVARYRNSPVMHPDVLEQFKPLTFQQGCRVPFPPPTCIITSPFEF